MMEGMHIEAVLAAGYAIFLVGVAFVLELLARYSHRRSQGYEHSGFTYRRAMDLWECPTGQQLLRTEIDHRLRIVRYRAAAKTCNSCPLKANCTDSDGGRQLELHIDSWVESELRRFHRGLSLVLLLLALLILAAEMARHSAPKELAALGSLFVVIVAASATLLSEFLSARGKAPV
jgi:Transposase DDE domain